MDVANKIQQLEHKIDELNESNNMFQVFNYNLEYQGDYIDSNLLELIVFTEQQLFNYEVIFDGMKFLINQLNPGKNYAYLEVENLIQNLVLFGSNKTVTETKEIQGYSFEEINGIYLNKLNGSYEVEVENKNVQFEIGEDIYHIDAIEKYFLYIESNEEKLKMRNLK